jgi:glutamate receptor, ionotropic, invertebrate
LEDFIKDTDPEKVPEKYQELYKRASFYDDENENIIDDVRKGKHVYIDWRSNLRSIMRREFLNTETCDFALSTEEFMEEQIALTLPINSPYVEVFNAGRLKHAPQKFMI